MRAVFSIVKRFFQRTAVLVWLLLLELHLSSIPNSTGLRHLLPSTTSKAQRATMTLTYTPPSDDPNFEFDLQPEDMLGFELLHEMDKLADSVPDGRGCLRYVQPNYAQEVQWVLFVKGLVSDYPLVCNEIEDKDYEGDDEDEGKVEVEAEVERELEREEMAAKEKNKRRERKSKKGRKGRVIILGTTMKRKRM